MTDDGLKAVSNPSAIFLSQEKLEISGSVVMAAWEGTRPLLLEVQALVDDGSSSSAHARRLALGLDNSRLAMLLALMHRYLGMHIHSQDVFVNVVGGMKVTETAIDLAIVIALISSDRDKIIPRNTVVFGELGLGGEVRPVQNGQQRISEAIKHGFANAIVPTENAPKIADIHIIAISHIKQIIDYTWMYAVCTIAFINI